MLSVFLLGHLIILPVIGFCIIMIAFYAVFAVITAFDYVIAVAVFDILAAVIALINFRAVILGRMLMRLQGSGKICTH
jgi:hypothetical protein